MFYSQSEVVVGESVIGNTVRIKGELNGAEPIHIAEWLIGSITLTGNIESADGDVMAEITSVNLTVNNPLRVTHSVVSAIPYRRTGEVGLLAGLIRQRIEMAA